jgi:hypothetical protein
VQRTTPARSLLPRVPTQGVNRLDSSAELTHPRPWRHGRAALTTNFTFRALELGSDRTTTSSALNGSPRLENDGKMAPTSGGLRWSS